MDKWTYGESFRSCQKKCTFASSFETNPKHIHKICLARGCAMGINQSLYAKDKIWFKSYCFIIIALFKVHMNLISAC
jgi:hypothetical protein